MAQIPHCDGSGVDQWLQLRLDPLAWEPPNAMGAALEKVKRKKKKNSPCNICNTVVLAGSQGCATSTANSRTFQYHKKEILTY